MAYIDTDLDLVLTFQIHHTHTHMYCIFSSRLPAMRVFAFNITHVLVAILHHLLHVDVVL